MIRRGLASELRWFIAVMVAAGVIGLAIGHVLAVLCVVAVCYVAWLLVCMHRLESWVIAARRKSPPTNTLQGIFGEIAEDVVLLNNRYQKDKLRLQAVVTRVQDMTSALTDGVVLIDSRGNIEWWNEAARKMFDLRDVDHGHKLTNIIRHPRFVKYYDSGDYAVPLDLDSVRREGQHLQFQVHPFGEGERLVVVRDVTRVFKLERMRKDFVANVSHELRTPLTVLRGYLETLSGTPNIPKPWERPLDQMQAQCQRMTALINDLITLSKLETDDTEMRQEPVKISHLVQTIVSDARALSGDGEHVITHSGDSQLTLRGNDKELHSAISNLVFNAVKYSPAKATVHVSYDVTDVDVVVRVTDTGLGIDPKHIPRLTERFYRVDEGRHSATGGTGLGLAIVKHVLWRHDAELKIESRPGKGSVFSCHFPLNRLVSASSRAS